MQHHRGGDVVEHAGLQHQHLAAAGLLGGGAEQHDRQVQLVGDLGQRQRRADRGRRDDVVPAGVSDAGQRVVLGADADDQRAAAEVGAERGVQPAGRRGDLEAALGDQRLRLGAAAVFGEGEFRFGVNRVRQLDQVATTSLDGVLDGRRRGGGGHRSSISPSRAALHQRECRDSTCYSSSATVTDARSDAWRRPTRPPPLCAPAPASTRFDVAVVLGSGLGARRRANSANRRPSCRWPSCPASPRRRRRATAARCCRCGRRASGCWCCSAESTPTRATTCATSCIRCGRRARRACARVVLTNAAGGLREDYAVGQPVLISDHLNLTARSPLVGAQFVDLVDAYSPRLRALAREVDPIADRGRLRRAARAALRDAGRDPDAAHARRRPGRHVDGARDDRGARGRAPRCWASRW